MQFSCYESKAKQVIIIKQSFEEVVVLDSIDKKQHVWRLNEHNNNYITIVWWLIKIYLIKVIDYLIKEICT